MLTVTDTPVVFNGDTLDAVILDPAICRGIIDFCYQADYFITAPGIGPVGYYQTSPDCLMDWYWRETWTLVYTNVMPSGIVTGKAINPGKPVITVYPNPFSTSVNFYVKFPDSRIPGLPNLHVSIYDIKGGLITPFIKSGNPQSGNPEISWDALNHPPGVYLIQLRQNSRIISSKKVVKR
jgi:hypothetical protein